MTRLAEPNHPAYALPTLGDMPFPEYLLESTGGGRDKFAVDTLITVADYYASRELPKDGAQTQVGLEDSVHNLLTTSPGTLLERADGNTKQRNRIIAAMSHLEGTQSADSKGMWEN